KFPVVGVVLDHRTGDLFDLAGTKRTGRQDELFNTSRWSLGKRHGDLSLGVFDLGTRNQGVQAAAHQNRPDGRLGGEAGEPAEGVEPSTPALRMRCSAN